MAENWRVVAQEIDGCRYLELLSAEGREGRDLRVVVEESIPRAPENPERDFVPELVEKIRSAMSAAPVQRSFEIIFQEYISYTMLNETYGRFPETPEAFTGKFFRIFSWSYLLELARKTTYVSDDHPGPGPLQHYSIACLNDVVDVITCVQPVMRRLT